MPYPGYQLYNVLGRAWVGLVGRPSWEVLALVGGLWECVIVSCGRPVLWECVSWEACGGVYPVGGLGVSSPVRRRGRIGVSRQWRNLNMIISCE